MMKTSFIVLTTLTFAVPGVIPLASKAESITADLLLTSSNVAQTLKDGQNLLTYDEPNFPLKTRYPATMKVLSSGSGEGVGIFFTFKPQGNALDEAEISFFLPKGSATLADFETFGTGPNGLIENNDWQLDTETTDTSEFPYPWIKKVIHFSTDKEQSGRILLGETNGQAVQVILLYPAEMSQDYWPSAQTILENLEFKSELLPIGVSQNQVQSINNSILTETIKTYVEKEGSNLEQTNYKSVEIDLDGDNKKDALVLLQGMYWCGTGGCSMVVFQGTETGFRFVDQIPLVREPVLVSETRTQGWRDIIVRVSGGGIKAKDVLLRFSGSTYPSNPSMENPISPETKIQGVEVFPEPQY